MKSAAKKRRERRERMTASRSATVQETPKSNDKANGMEEIVRLMVQNSEWKEPAPSAIDKSAPSSELEVTEEELFDLVMLSDEGKETLHAQLGPTRRTEKDYENIYLVDRFTVHPTNIVPVINALKSSNGVSQNKIAVETGLTQGNVSQKLKGKRAMSLTDLEKFLDALGYTVRLIVEKKTANSCDCANSSSGCHHNGFTKTVDGEL